MKPSKMRNKMIHNANNNMKNKHLVSLLSSSLQKKYGRKNARVMEGDSVMIIRGEYKSVSGKVSAVSTAHSNVAIDGVKKEKAKGDKFDVYIHASNIMITALNEDDKLRSKKLRATSTGTISEPSKSESDTLESTSLKSEMDMIIQSDTLESPSLKNKMELDTQSEPSPETTQSEPSPETTQSEPSPETTQSEPAPETTQSEPAPETTQSEPAPETTQSEPTSDTSKDSKEEKKDDV